MESDEKYILSRFGNKNHFTVPEGYFEHLQDDIFTSVAMLEEKRQWRHARKKTSPRPFRSAAECSDMLLHAQA